MNAIAIFLALAAAAADPAPRRDLGELHAQFIESVDAAKRQAALEEISRTTPATPRDVKWLFDLFMRFPEPAVRDAVMASLGRLDEKSPHLEPAFIELLKMPENEAVIFGINGVLRLRAPRALPLVTEIAERRLRFKSPGEAPLLSERNAWWAQYEALSALAQWQGAKALPLLRRRADEAPAVARLMALYLWKESLPQIILWANAAGASAEKAHEALSADVPLPALRASWPEMLKVLRDRKADRELRHQIAIKAGFCSDDARIESLLSEWGSAQDPETKLMLATALFASRSPRTVPWLKKQAADNPAPRTRLGALLQLREMLPPAESSLLIEQAVALDPDPDNRQTLADMLKAPAGR